MPVPDYQTLMLPVLKLFADGKVNVSQCLSSIKNEFEISDEEAEELIPSGRVTLLSNRTHWARTYLSKAGLLTSPKRNVHVITDRGKVVLARQLNRIDNKVLSEFDNFTEWRELSTSSVETTASQVNQNDSTSNSDQTPEEALESANNALNAALKDELIEILLTVSPVRFERLILDFLNSLGYGGGKLSTSQLTKAGSDGGIDGVINEDALGLDAVYIQAKRYSPENKIGRPHIQQFIGSLTGESATKGVFVTTSDFSQDALDYVKRVQQRIVLINGEQLAQLMINHEVGVRIRTTYFVRTIDEDYFTIT